MQPKCGTPTDGISRLCAGSNFAGNGAMESHLSENQREGSLGEVPLAEVLETCRRYHFTGKIEVRAGEHAGELELNAGVVDAARFEAKTGDPALMTMCALHNGQYKLSQRLPDLD